MATNVKYETRAAVRLEMVVGAGKSSGAVEFIVDMPVYLMEASDSDNKATVELVGVSTVIELTVTGADAAGNSAVAIGDKIYKDGAQYNKDGVNGKWIGYALETVSSGGSTAIDVALVGAVAEAGILNDLTVSAAELNKLNGAPLDASFVIGAEAANVINVAVQLKDADGADLAVRGSLLAYLSDDANGDSIVATAPDGGWAIGTDGLLIPVVASKAAQLTSEADGDIDVNITHAAGAKTCYLILILPTGKLIASAAITFAA